MVEIILKDNIDKSKMDVLLQLLKSWDIHAELKKSPEPVTKKKSEFSLSASIWENYIIDSGELRKKAWNRNR